MSEDDPETSDSPDDEAASDGRADGESGDDALETDIDLDDADPALEDRFVEESVADVDPEAVWERLDDEDAEVTDAAVDALFEGETNDGFLDADLGDETSEAVVAKRSYCQRCQFFSSPPEVACRNPGTEIVELVDVDHFRVRNCPIVERRHGTTAVLDDDA